MKKIISLCVFQLCLLTMMGGTLQAGEKSPDLSINAAEALVDIPTELTAIPRASGFSGVVILGGSYNWLKSNMVAGNDLGDVGHKRIDSIFDEPDPEWDVTPAISLDLRYTFAESGTQLFIGNRLEDLLRYDLAFQAGVRQDLGNPGILGAAFVFSAIPTEVWKDPYVEGEKRRETDRSSRGVRISWERIFAQRLTFEYTYRDIDINSERSGQFLGLDAAERDLLDRRGNSHEIEALYMFELTTNQALTPSLQYTLFDLDGGAMKHDRLTFQLTHSYIQDRFKVISNFNLGHADYDRRHPIYAKRRDDDNFGISSTAFWHRPFGWNNWSLLVSGAYAKSNSNIEFYDQEGFLGTTGLMYRF